MSDNSFGNTNYPQGFPNPEKVGFFALSQVTGSGIDQAGSIKKACELLNRPPVYTDKKGYEYEMVGATVEEQTYRIAWVEGRSKRLGSGTMDVEFRLRARVSGTDVLNWEVATYNPYFGCQVGYMGWWGDQVIVVYREKHSTLVAAAPLQGSVRLFPIHDEWAFSDSVLFYLSEEPDLVEILLIPELVRGLPVHSEAPPKLPAAPLRVPLPEDVNAFQHELKATLFPSTSFTLESELIIGALTYRFWQRFPVAGPGYTTGRGPWNSPCWLPFHWYVTLDPSYRKPFVELLDEVAARDIPQDLGPVSIASTYVARRCSAIAGACRAEKLPEKAHCYFWVDWSMKAIAKDLDLFPRGFRRAFEILRPHASRWKPF